MTQKKRRKRANPQKYMPDPEHVASELGKAESMDDFFGKLNEIWDLHKILDTPSKAVFASYWEA
jgi:hypothetical protein